ncbi:MAG: DMT family transporter, partial [Fimbriimonadaceae bacterium]|nr:DMT family transporter [Alphaproteobacteria bacterium]
VHFWSLLVGGVVTFGTAYYLMFAGVRLIGATRTSIVMNLEPIFTALLSAFILLEALSPLQILGAVLVILSVAAAQVRARSVAVI